MATNGYTAGNTRLFTAAADISSGDVVVLADCLGVAQVDIANGATGTVLTKGAVTVPKHATSNAITQGQKVWYDVTGEKVYNAPVNGYYYIGRAGTAAAAAATTVVVELGAFVDEGAREITLAATGAQILAAANFLNGSGLAVKVPNTGAVTVTFPLMSTVPYGVYCTIRKSAADAAAITVAANASDSLIGTTGTIDAANDRATLQTQSGGPVVIATTIA